MLGRIVALPHRPVRERAELLSLALIRALQHSGVQLDRHHALLNPLDDRPKHCLRERSILCAGRAVRGARHDVEAVELVQLLHRVRVARVRVHDAADLLLVDD